MVNLVILSQDKAGVLRDQYGHFCNEQGYILNEDGYYSFTENWDAGRHQKPPQISFSYTKNWEASQYHKPPQGNFSFTRNYEASHYQSLPAPTELSKLERMMEQVLEGQQRMIENLMGKFDEIEEDFAAKSLASIDAPQHRSTPFEFSESVEHETAVSIDTSQHRSIPVQESVKDVLKEQASIDTLPTLIDTPKASIDTAEKLVIDTRQDMSIDRHHPSIDRHHAEPAIPNIEKFQSVEERTYKPPWMRCIPSARHSLPHSRPPDASGLPVRVPNPPDPEPDPKPPEHNETVVVEMSPKEAATPGSCHKRKFHDITLQPPLKRIRANSGAAVIPTTAYLIDPGDTYAVYSRGQRPPPEQWYVLFELRSSPAGTRSYPPRSHPYVAYMPDPETTDVVYHMGPRPP